MYPGRCKIDLVVACALLWLGSAGLLKAQENPSKVEISSAPEASQTGSATGSTSQATATDTTLIQEEVGDRDITYLRTRAVFRYDYIERDGPTETNRFRLKLVYGFGPNQRFGVAVNVPVVWLQTPTGTVFGSGDTDVTGGVVVYQTKQLRTGFIGELTVPTSSEIPLGGGNTNLKGSWGITYVLNKRFEVYGSFSYKQSVSTSFGIPVKQFEPDVALNFRVLKTTWYLESDSYYDFNPEQFAPMIKTGLARAWGETKNWTTSAYIEWPLDHMREQRSTTWMWDWM